MEPLKNPLKDLHNYNSDMSISQVVKFFERQGISFTKTMIQNYVRIGAIPPPHDKRIYRVEQLMMLVLLDGLKSVYSLDEIKSSFKPVLDDSESMGYVYADYLDMYREAQEFWQGIISESDDNQNFLLKLMAFSVATKDLAEELMQTTSIIPE